MRFCLLLLCLQIVSVVKAATFVVTNNRDGGIGTLRQAILNANSNPGYDIISFSMPGTYQHIELVSQLPAITERLYINGWSQGGLYYTGAPLIELNGGGAIANGISLSANNCTVNGLSIGGFTNGIYITSNSNFICGNYIGLFADGTVNANYIGIYSSTANANTIGSNLDGAQDIAERNIISGNTTGIKLSQSSSNNIYGNYIGTDVTGSAGQANTENGLEITNASNNTIVGSANSAGRNIISANANFGIRIEASNSSWIKGNYIGTDKTGKLDLGNLSQGIYLCCGAAYTIIGSNGDGYTDLGERNVIACNDRHPTEGNSYSNIRIEGPNSNYTVISGNFIGISAEGKAFAPNGGMRGIQAYNGVMGLIVGGASAYTRNVISGHQHVGVEFVELNNSRISGNYIGTDTLGYNAIPNGYGGVQFWSNVINSTIGTDGDGSNDALEGNLISGNKYGVVLVSGCNQNKISGNSIGTNIRSTAPIANAAGIYCWQSDYNTFGGLLPAQRNIISGNTDQGILFSGSSKLNQVINNYIGLDQAGNAMGNGSDGIRFTETSGNNTIGGTANGSGNSIQYNGGNGINALGGTGNSFRKNSIYNNAKLGIDLNDDGVTQNELLDSDRGPNNLQNFPYITSVAINASGVDLSGIMYGEPSTVYELEFYATPSMNPSGYGEGLLYLGTTIVSTDASATAVYALTLPATVSANAFITATATAPDKSTSEFSGPYEDALPVELIRFEVFPKNTMATLQWQSASEIGVEKYVIYSSENSIDFDSIGQVYATGNLIYTFSDIRNVSRMYYKIKIVDLNGATIYSSIRLFSNSNASLINVYPNPCLDQLFIDLKEFTKNVTVKIISATGNSISESYYLQSTQIRIDTDTLASGLYTLIVVTEKEVKNFPLTVVK